MNQAQHYPASYEQDRSYVLEQLVGGSMTLCSHRAFVVSGHLRDDVVRRKCRALSNRHDILRTELCVTRDGLVQRVRDEIEPEVSTIDVSGDPAPDARARQLVESFLSRPFELGVAPLWRTLLVATGEDRHVLVVAMHTAAADAETLALVCRELLGHGVDASDGQDGATAVATRQYREHAMRQRSIDAGTLQRQEEYWSTLLSGEPQPAELPAFVPRAADSDLRHRALRIPLPPDLVELLEQAARSSDSPASTVLTAAFAALLYRYGARDETTFCRAVSQGRPGGEGPALGPYRNVVPLRLVITAGTTFEEVLAETQGQLDRADQHGDYPYQQLLRHAPATSDAGPYALFPLLFDCELDLVPALSAGEAGMLAVTDYDLAPVSVGHDVHVTARRLTSGTVMDWSYRAALFPEDQITQVAGHFVQMLWAVLRHPEMPVATVPYLGPDELDRIRQRWNTRRTPYRRCAVHQLIVEQAARTPGTTAVEFRGERLSYAELDRRADLLAWRLLDAGVRRDDMVGLCLDRSIELVVAVVAIMKAGCAVVPLDAAYPPDRLDFMLRDAGVRVVVTDHAALLDRRPAVAALFAPLTKVSADAIADAGPDRPLPEVSQDAIAYCIYTSGSTGLPKGVAVAHSALANLVSWHRAAWLSEVGTRTLLYSPISFDVSFHEILAGLCMGATLIQVDEDTRCNPMALLAFAHQERVAKWYMPFVALQQAAQAAQTGAVPEHLRELIVGGEVLRITPEIRDFAARTGCVIHNHYGSTECIDVATHTLSGDPSRWPAIAPIGTANVDNMNLFILDEARQLVPIGVVGELYAEGDCLAAHYHGRPELTAERFVASPFGVQGARLYRLGDVGRYLPDGTIECLGRTDNQTKIRGFRVEPSEVEAVLAEHHAVSECVVTAKVNGRRQTRLVAYVTPEDAVERLGLIDALRTHLAGRLPDYMRPTSYVLLDSLPLTPSGKLDVRGLPEPVIAGPNATTVAAADSTGIIARVWAELLDVPEVPSNKTFFELGGDSISLVLAHQQISSVLRRSIPIDALFRYPTLAELTRFLGEAPDATDGEPAAEAPLPEPADSDRDVAIVGMACRVPGAADVEQFWRNLCDGVESVTRLRDAQIHRLEPDQTEDPRFVPAAALLADADLFDAAFFGYSAAEAAVIDPQQRLFLECAWEAVEDSGLDTRRHRVGVWAGASLNTYLINNVLPAKLGDRTFLSHRHFAEATELRIEQGNASDHLPTRVAFKLDLRGPSVNVQTTCSTSLVAVHAAVQALLAGDCDVALAGGVSIITPQNTGYLWREGMMVSSDGHCRAFDADADGTVFGNGLGVVVLKRLSTALADGDRVYAVVKGSAVNNDGAGKMDYSGPSVAAQTEVIVRAQERAGVPADTISYVETHGTGTRLGDPIEIAGLTEAFRRGRARDGQFCAIGSVKTNIGHLDEAAGVLGLIKTALSLHHGQLPPSLHFRSPNPLAGLAESPFFVNTELRAWPAAQGHPRRAGISSFGMGGTNCHVVIEEAPPRPGRPTTGIDRRSHLLPVSAKTEPALRANLQRHLRHLDGRDTSDFADFCYSAATGRQHFDHRIAIQAADIADARAQIAALLQAPDIGRPASWPSDERPRIAFACAGQGSHYLGMGRSLYDTQPVFRAAVDRCDELLRPELGRSLTGLLYGEQHDPAFDRTATTQPALFTIGYALSQLWQSWGVSPDVLIGHSIGEYVAACVGGVFSLEDAARLVAARGRLMQALPEGGGMAQIGAGVETVRRHLTEAGGSVAIAAVNAADLTVLSGPREALEQVCRTLRADGIEVVALNVDRAFHSPLMTPILDEFRAVAETVRYAAPSIDIVSTVTGSVLEAVEMSHAGYWVRHIVDPVRFSDAVSLVEQGGTRIFVELGPKAVLSALGRRRPGARGSQWLPSMTPRDADAAIAAYRRLYLTGVPVDWTGFDAPFARRRVPVPTYAFQRGRHWLDPRPAGSAAHPPMVATSQTRDDPGPADTVQMLVKSWSPVVLGSASAPAARRVAVLGSASRLTGVLRARAKVVVETDALAGCDTVVLVLEPDGPAALLTAVRDVLEPILDRAEGTRLWLVAPEPGTEAPLGHAGIGALARTLNAEHAELRCTALTILGADDPGNLAQAAALVEAGAPGEADELVIEAGLVLDGRLRTLHDSPLPAGRALPVRSDGTYLITGGTGGLGLRLALAMAQSGPARLVLVSRRGEPDQRDRHVWVALRATGVAVDVVRADVTDAARMRSVLDDCGAGLRGVVHCAGSVRDGPLLRQGDEVLATVLRPKVDGAWLLHELTRDRTLDFFVLSSSLASLLGYRGQAGYAVANEFLDELARHRRRLGLPALSVSWGSWAEAGMTARLSERHRTRLIDEGERPITAEAAVRALATLIAAEVPHAAVASMDWARYAATQPRTTPMIAEFAPDNFPAPPEAGASSIAGTLRALPPDRARALLRHTVMATIQRLLGGGEAELDATQGFVELGVDSLGALDLRARLQETLGCRLPATVIFERPSPDELVRYLGERHFAADIEAVPAPGSTAAPGTLRPEIAPVPANPPVAIIGMSCRLPGADSPGDLWELLIEGRDAVREIPDQRWALDHWYDESAETPGKMYVRRAGLIDEADCFDPAFFGISPREAASMDPRHRLLLESAWSVVESAGIDPSTLRGTDTGVYLGCDEFLNDYLRQADGHLGDEPYLATGTTLSFTAGRISYKLGLHGPSIVTATACSSSLVALHSAVRAIRQDECGVAIVGGAKLMLAPEETVQLCRLSALSPDGVSKAFSAEADGFGRGEGVVTLLIKRLDRAVADGDPVYAVIRGSAVNHDGPSAGLTVPNGGAQARLIVKALADAGMSPADVTYLETHGTGTQLGDPIEVNALGDVFRQRDSPLLLGSVKANIGHLEEASGLAGVVKAVLALQHGVIPPQIHCADFNHNVDWSSLPVAVPRTTTAWPAGRPRTAGVSSFGMSGTNAHVVLESYQQPPAPAAAYSAPFVFPFSARDDADLAALLSRFADALPTLHDPAGVAWTLQSGRQPHRHRLAVVAADFTALRECLTHLDGPGVVRGLARTSGSGPAEIDDMLRRRDLAGLARAWCEGQVVDWAALHDGEPPARTALPTYPFKRMRLWLGPERTAPPLRSEPVSVPEPVPTVPAPRTAPDDRPDLLEALREHVAGLLGMPGGELSATDNIGDLGADSLTFMRLSQFIRDRHQVVISFQELTEEADSLVELARMVAQRLPASGAVTASPARVESSSPARAPATYPVEPEVSPAPVATVAEAPQSPRSSSGPSGPQHASQPTDTLTERQSRFLTDLVAAYSARTGRSKAAAEGNRDVLANCRMPPWQALCKEMAYPVVVDRSAGARFWDVDGQEYVDISMGYGVHLFGHQPDFVVNALRDQLDRGLHIGPQTGQSGHVARLLCELTGTDRAVFCNSGTEAVMAALRFARAATGRTRFVMFEGSYHGWSDSTLALPAGADGAIPMTRGIGAGAMNDVVVLEYGAPESLDAIRALGPQLAAVLVEPVQSRRPDLQPTGFLRELREITQATGTALIFDEVITGFRVGPGGAQAWCGVRADLVTYGKILGGGMPIGAVAGRAEFMDTVDGGAWKYGDNSSPAVPTTFFGGTFNKNPLTMAAAEAVLTHLRDTGAQPQRELADRVTRMAQEFNDFCQAEGFPLRMVHFSSLFRFIGEGEYSLQRFPLAIDLFFHLMGLRGIYVLETRVCFLSTAHTPDDVRFVLDTAKACLSTLRGAGFFAPPADPVPAPRSGLSRLINDALPDPVLVPPSSAPATDARHVLLTGATGFLGAYLTAELLRHTEATLHCLVRADDEQHARDRVLANLRTYDCLDNLQTDRIVGVVGDLARQRLGLSDQVWQRLADSIDAIYHNGAQVNSLLPYEKLRAANVEGTRELLRLAVQGRAKAFHYISSDAVFDAYGYHRQARIYEDEPLRHCDSLYGGGYAESKWVADKLVVNARQAGLTASIYRPGMLTGALSGGCGQTGDFFARFLRGIIQLGICPELDAIVDIAPVDLVSRTIVGISKEAGGQTYHLTHPQPIPYEEFIDAVREAGYQLEMVPLHVWDAELARIRYEDDNPLYPLLPLFIESSDPVLRRSRLDVRNTTAGAPEHAPPDLRKLIPMYVERFREAGLLTQPNRTGWSG
ncbi:amino acid adenylation domain-containing protein [Micromonospora echinospora]|uniref:non-ribosomal peptide synthetase/type I polyketide synthase n=1 Tax=Micromonospora echinospora TaxID=1877 RepID=UPI00344AE279